MQGPSRTHSGDEAMQPGAGRSVNRERTKHDTEKCQPHCPRTKHCHIYLLLVIPSLTTLHGIALRHAESSQPASYLTGGAVNQVLARPQGCLPAAKGLHLHLYPLSRTPMYFKAQATKSWDKVLFPASTRAPEASPCHNYGYTGSVGWRGEDLINLKRVFAHLSTVDACPPVGLLHKGRRHCPSNQWGSSSPVTTVEAGPPPCRQRLSGPTRIPLSLGC